jgi:exo-beta-1,3-glucanase (GH17 family)
LKSENIKKELRKQAESSRGTLEGIQRDVTKTENSDSFINSDDLINVSDYIQVVLSEPEQWKTEMMGVLDILNIGSEISVDYPI